MKSQKSKEISYLSLGSALFPLYNIIISYQNPVCYQSTLSHQYALFFRLAVQAIYSMRLFSLHFHHFVVSIQTFIFANIAFWCKSIKYIYAYTFHKLHKGMNIFPTINHPSDILITLYKLGKQLLRI